MIFIENDNCQKMTLEGPVDRFPEVKLNYYLTRSIEYQNKIIIYIFYLLIN